MVGSCSLLPEGRGGRGAGEAIEPLLVEATDLGRHLPVVELPRATIFPLVTPGFPQVRSFGKLHNRFRQTWDIFGRDQSAGNAIEDDFTCAIDIETDGWDTAQERLREGSCEAFTKAAVGKDIAGAQVAGHLFGRDQTCEKEMVSQSGSIDLRLQFRLENAVPHQQELQLRLTLDGDACGFDQQGVPFQVKQSSDFADDDILRMESQLLPHRFTMALRLQERLNLHPAVDGRE